MYVSETCGLNESDIHFLDFHVNRFLMELFKTASSGIIQNCLACFEFGFQSFLIVGE